MGSESLISSVKRSKDDNDQMDTGADHLCKFEKEKVTKYNLKMCTKY